MCCQWLLLRGKHQAPDSSWSWLGAVELGTCITHILEELSPPGSHAQVPPGPPRSTKVPSLPTPPHSLVVALLVVTGCCTSSSSCFKCVTLHNPHGKRLSPQKVLSLPEFHFISSRVFQVRPDLVILCLAALHSGCRRADRHVWGDPVSQLPRFLS